VFDKEEVEAIEAERSWQLAIELADKCAATAADLQVSMLSLFIHPDEIRCSIRTLCSRCGLLRISIEFLEFYFKLYSLSSLNTA
jgi:hypothetical protein